MLRIVGLSHISKHLSHAGATMRQLDTPGTFFYIFCLVDENCVGQVEIHIYLPYSGLSKVSVEPCLVYTVVVVALQLGIIPTSA